MKSILLRFADLRITSVLLLVFALETLVGTLMQAHYGLYAAQQLFFHNWFGVPLVGAIALLNLVAVLCVRMQWKPRNAGLIVLHLGLISLLTSAGLGYLVSEQGYMDLGSGERRQHADSQEEWEIAFRAKDDSGATVWSIPLAQLKVGQNLELGPLFPQCKVAALAPNGAIGPGNTIIPVQAGKEPAIWSPAISLSNGIALSPQSVPWSPKPGHELALRRKSFALPFALQLKEFKRNYHPGTSIAASYESKVMVVEGKSQRDVIISMNQPLRFGEYTVFQSSWSTDSQTGLDRSTLSVMRNPLRNGPYAATLLIALGLFLHLGIRWRVSFSSVSTILWFSLFALPSLSQATKIPENFKQLPILADGRVKPLETYAHHLLLQISGKSSVVVEDSLKNKQRLNAMDWFTGLLLGSPYQNVPVFLVENPEVRDALGLRGKERDRYSWTQLLPLGMRLDSLAQFAQQIAPDKRSAMQRDLLRIADSWNRYYSILHALDYAIENPMMAPYKCFLEFAQNSSVIRPKLDRLLQMPPDSLDVNGKAYLAWVNGVLGSADTWALAVFPVSITKREQGAPLYSPGEILLKHGLEEPQSKNQIEAWAHMRKAWLTGNADSIQKASSHLSTLTMEQVTGTSIRPQALQWEHFYNRLNPFYHALLLYFLMLVPAIIGLKRNKQRWIQAAAFLGLFTLALQGVGIALRMYITLRPPVTNLFETFVFASACAVFLLLIIGHFRKFSAAPFLAAVSGILLLLLARRYGSDGDTMPVLAAVLNSNFWLTIHVLTITLGYAGVVAAGVVAHWHLVIQSRAPKSDSTRAAAKLVKEIMAFGLLFTFVGTLLGGIWADQSWGRFWGWDPKENGALLIILWVAFQFHAVPAGWFKDRGFSLASLFAIQTVVFAWFGVNLMGVGLHSYGFTQGTLVGIVLFALLEGLFAFWVLRGTPVPHLKREPLA